ncbi:MAG: PadR family transcriptional regulator [Actinobacteria bacterium]|nr:PadR family transcriptional regulator [Actinomycetota bacterium]
MTSARVKVLQAMLAAPGDIHYGYALMRSSGVKSGSLYPNLEQFEKVGWVESHWEELDTNRSGRPPRRCYRFTRVGERQATRAVLEFLSSRPPPVTTRLRPSFDGCA